MTTAEEAGGECGGGQDLPLLERAMGSSYMSIPWGVCVCVSESCPCPLGSSQAR